MLLSAAGYSQTSAAKKLNYNGVASFQSAIKNRDIKLTVLHNICMLCGLQIIITDNKTININLTEYIQQHTNDNNATGDDSATGDKISE